MAAKPKILVLGSAPSYVDQLYLKDFEKEFVVDVLPAVNRAETKEMLAGKVKRDGPYAAFMIKFGTLPYEPYDEDLLGALGTDCKIITSCSAGYNEFDVDWMTRAGYWFCNTVDAVSEPTADMAILLILATVRNMRVAENQARQGQWKTGLTPCQDPVGLTLGILGLGAIGKHTARKAAVFGMKIKYHNRRRLSAAEEAMYHATYCATLHEMLATSDVISISCPLTAETTNLISGREFEVMKEGAFLINTARGAIVDEEALIAALESGKVTRAGLDVFPDEPNINEYLKSTERVILQPHMGGLTRTAFARSEMECLENIRKFFKTGMPNSPVNRPGRIEWQTSCFFPRRLSS